MNTLLTILGSIVYLLIAAAIHRGVYMAYMVGLGEPPKKWRTIKVGLFWPWYVTTWIAQSTIGDTRLRWELVADQRRHALDAMNHLEFAWSVIASAGNPIGDWNMMPAEWVEAAEEWRDGYYRIAARRPNSNLLLKILNEKLRR
jgi:hypothetical protein